jgi:hypothetical protein
MTDYFAVLGITPRPWVEPEEIQARFLAVSAPTHPDRFHEAGKESLAEATQRFTQINAAYQCLRLPGECLRHYLDLRGVIHTKGVHPIPPNLLELFRQVSATCREIDAVLQQKAQAQAPLLKAQAFAAGTRLNQRLEETRRELQQHLNAVTAELQADSRTLTATSGCAPSAADLARWESCWNRLSFLRKWQAQLDERRMKLLG